MIDIILGIGHLAASNTPHTQIKTYALGSCVAIILLCPRMRSVGMVHVALAEAQINPGKAATLPGYFADTGLPALLKEMGLLTGRLGPAELYAKITGGASLIGTNDTFNIGQRNIRKIKELLAGSGIRLVAEDVGGTISRTVAVATNTGEVEISSPGRPNWKL